MSKAAGNWRHRLRLWAERLQHREEALRIRIEPYVRRWQEQSHRMFAAAHRVDQAADAYAQPYRKRASVRYQQLLQRYPTLDITAGRFYIIGTLLWAHVRTLSNFLAQQWPQDLRPTWPPHKAADWLTATALMTVLFFGANLQAPYLPSVPGTDRAWEVIGYYENEQGGIFGSSFPTLQEQHHLIDTVSPFWYSLGPDGEIVSARHDPQVMDQARRAGQRVIPLVINVIPLEGDRHALIATPEQRQLTVESLVQLMDQRGYDGLNIYFPWLGPIAREPFTEFVSLLADQLRARGRLLGISVYPREDAAEEVHGAFDYAALGTLADYLVLMAYDHHWEESGPGPTAPLPWVEENLRSALSAVPADRLVLAVGLYGYDWGGPTQYLPSHAARSRAERLEAPIKRDQASGQPFYTYTAAGVSHEVWFEDSVSFTDKIALVERHQLRGVALWRLGFEQDHVWQHLQERLGER